MTGREMPTHFLIKGTAECDSYYQSLIVAAASGKDPLRAVESYLADEECRLLAVDPSETREVEILPESWRARSTPFGVVAGGGRIFIIRRYAGRGFREITSLEYSGASASAMLLALESLCRDSDLFLAAIGAAVPGAQRIRCGLRSVWLIEADDIRRLPAVEAFLTGDRERAALFMIPSREKARISAMSGLLCRPDTLRKTMLEAAWCVIEDGDFLCREDFHAPIMRVTERAQDPDRE